VRIPTYSPPRLQDLSGVPKDAEWIQAALEPRDTAIEDLVEALQARLGVENFNAVEKVFTVRHDVEVVVSVTLPEGSTPTGVTLLWNSGHLYGIPSIRFVEKGRVGLKVYFIGTPTDAVSIKLRFV
jgi:hypothetical protein